MFKIFARHSWVGHLHHRCRECSAHWRPWGILAVQIDTLRMLEFKTNKVQSVASPVEQLEESANANSVHRKKSTNQ